MWKPNSNKPSFQPQKQTTLQTFDQQYLYSLNIALCNNFEKVLDVLGHEMERFNNYFCSFCPIHDGDNKTALTIYTQNEPYGWWLCNTRGCSQHFPKNAIGFIWAFLSAQNGWTDKNNKKIHFSNCLNICKKIVGHIDPMVFSFKKKIILEGSEQIQYDRVSREIVRNSLSIPADFYLKKGFAREVLDFFDVGLPKTTKEMRGRVVVPIYNADYFYLGCQGRSLDGSHPKWKNSSKLPLESILYNIHNAKEFIKKTKTIILVEGPPDVWNLWQHGIRNCVATLGPFKGQQRIILETSGAINIVCMFDNDEAGIQDFESVKAKCSRLFNVSKLQYGVEGQDPAELNKEELHSVLGQFVN
jgi:hypothetical protein